MSISPDQFLAQPSDPDESEETPLPAWTTPILGDVAFSPSSAIWQTEPIAPYAKTLDAIAASLAQIADCSVSTADADTWREEAADLEAKYESLFGLVADIEKLVSKSTSKLANSVRDAINAWKAPVAGPLRGAFTEDGEVDPIEEIVSIPPRPSTSEAIIQPAHDAPVEEWRAYGRGLAAQGIAPVEGIDWSQMNRSQIRSVLGISQTGSDTGA